MKKKYSGTVVPMITPLMDNWDIDVEAVHRIMTEFAGNDISPLVLGTTGESPSIDLEKSLTMVEAAIEAKQDNQLIYVGLVENNENEIIRRLELYARLGADVIVSTLPSYYTLTPLQIEVFYESLADMSDCPVMMYNIKATTQMSIPLDVAEKLSKHPNIVGLKDSERDAERLETCIRLFKDREDFSFFCGWGAKSFNSLRMGADGIVPSTGNVVPEMYKKLMDAFVSGDYELAEKMQKLTDEVASLYQKGRTLGESLAALKVIMEVKGLCGSRMMPPLTELSSEETDHLQKTFKQFYIY
ncbi:MAG: dihydrodipicolinate synthase family protein [Dysgonamonadaceae bacterium]|jgi:4-hydroxy-tetrahydrodipicolinate synthase|nr:dihydrodipicolinate synthase family protein [Dysgonamonadaceae bacterium]